MKSFLLNADDDDDKKETIHVLQWIYLWQTVSCVIYTNVVAYAQEIC